MDTNEILELLKTDCDSLWKCKKRGDTIEIITPFTTITQNFISIFITQRNGAYIVSDGGWIQEHINQITSDTVESEKLLDYFATYYNIGLCEANLRNYYFKSHTDIKMLSAISYDVVHFISSTVNTLYYKYKIDKVC